MLSGSPIRAILEGNDPVSQDIGLSKNQFSDLCISEYTYINTLKVMTNVTSTLNTSLRNIIKGDEVGRGL
jgi:hypothetical protein